jgi:lipopolysaccharide biosynthesis regulator YciM
VEMAVWLLEHVVAVEANLLPEEHPDRLSSQHTLASAYISDGHVEKAIRLLEHVVTERKVLEENHPRRLASQHDLARAYLANGQAKNAVQLFEHVVTVNEVLEEKHPRRLDSQHELARAYLANVQVEKALRLIENVVDVKERSMKAEHPSLLVSQGLRDKILSLYGKPAPPQEIATLEFAGSIERY